MLGVSMGTRVLHKTLFFAALVVFALLIALQGYALAAVPDADHPAEAVGQIATLWKNGTIPAAVIVAVYFVLVMLQKWIPSLKRGRQAVILAAVVGGLAIVTERATEGTTPNLSMILQSLLTALALYTRPEAPSAPTPAVAPTPAA